MSMYEWCEKEWTCDKCGKKERMPDRVDKYPENWLIIGGSITRQGKLGHSKKNGNHFCSDTCLSVFVKGL